MSTSAGNSTQVSLITEGSFTAKRAFCLSGWRPSKIRASTKQAIPLAESSLGPNHPIAAIIHDESLLIYVFVFVHLSLFRRVVHNWGIKGVVEMQSSNN